MKFLFFFIFSSVLVLSSCGSNTKVQRVERICSENTTLVVGKGIKITLGDFRYTKELLNSEAKRFFSSHPKELLERMINRRLVFNYVNDSGLAKKYGLDREMESFKKNYLSRYYVSVEAEKRMGKITKDKIVNRFRELFPNKDPSRMTEADERFIRNELRVKAYDKAVREIYDEVKKKIEIHKEGDFSVASCCGLKVKVKGKGDVVEKFLTEYFYRKALEKGYDKNPEFVRTFVEYFASKAADIFRKELGKEIEVSEREIKRFYEKNKEKFLMPPRVKAVVFYFHSKNEALKVREKLLHEDWKSVARRLGKFTLKPKVYYKDPKDFVGTLVFMNEGKRVLVADLGNNRYVVIKVLSIYPEKHITLKEAEKYIKLRLFREKLRDKEKEFLKELRSKYKVKVDEESLKCLV